MKLRLALIASMRARSVHELPLGEYASSRIVLISRTCLGLGLGLGLWLRVRVRVRARGRVRVRVG